MTYPDFTRVALNPGAPFRSWTDPVLDASTFLQGHLILSEPSLYLVRPTPACSSLLIYILAHLSLSCLLWEAQRHGDPASEKPRPLFYVLEDSTLSTSR